MKVHHQMASTFMNLIVLAVFAPLAFGGETARVSVSTAGAQANDDSFLPDLNEDGRFVTFYSLATTLVSGDTNSARDVFVYDRTTREITRVSVATGGGQSNDDSLDPALSADGRFVAFRSDATNLVPGDTNGATDVFVHDRQTGTTTRVSVATGGGQSNNNSFTPALSADGRFVTFHSFATNLVPGDTNGVLDVFVHDRQTGETSRVSVATGGTPGNNTSRAGFLSADGRFVSFESDATNLVAGDTNGERDIFVHDRQTGTTTRVSVATGGGQVNGGNVDAELSSDGRYVAFQSTATNLVSGDTNGESDVFVHDRQTTTTTRVSVASNGGPEGNGDSEEATISGDGRFVAFLSFATNLIPGDTNSEGDVFVHDRQTNTTTRMSVTTGGLQGNDFSCNPAISQDGRFVGFFSDSTNLVANDTNGIRDIFVHNRTVAFDLDGDGKADLLWRNTNNQVVAVWLMNGTTIASSGFPAGVPADWQIVGTGDVDANGQTDVIWRNINSGTVAVWLMNGLTILSVGFPGSTSTDWKIDQIGDLDGDGKADLIWRNTNDGVVAVWLMNGASIASSAFLGGVPAEWQIVGIGDVNGDNMNDVIWRNNAGIVAVWVMNGPTITSIGFPGSAPVDFELVGSGDVDGNGTADLFWRNITTGSVIVWLMNGTVIASSANVINLASDQKIVLVADTNGDGRPDLIVMNTSTGTVTVFLQGIGSGVVNTISQDWELQN